MTPSYPIKSNWKIYEKIALRGFFIYAIITIIPLVPAFYRQDFDAGFSVNNYPFRWLDVVSQNNPWFFVSKGGKNYEGWFITLILSIIAGSLWFLAERQLAKNKINEAKSNNTLYNWFFTLVRYQIALRMSWFAIAKVFPVQMPFPTISQLNTNLGDFTPGKLYWLTTGVSPFFEVFAGVFELAATIFILFRRTTTLGALMMIAILLPIWFVNIGYDAGVELASLHLLFLSLLILAKDARQFWAILIEHKNAALNYVEPLKFSKGWQRAGRLILKGSFILLFLVYRGLEYGKLHANGKTFKLPLDNGVQSFTGFYSVDEFKINNKSLAYSPYDSVRWQNVVFEKFNTISIRVAKPITINTNNKDRTTEYYGNIGRLFYGYDADTIKHQFVLRNRIDSASKITLNYIRPNLKTFVLSGINENKDSIFVVLNKVDKTYPLAITRSTSLGD